MSLTPAQLLEHERKSPANGCPVCGSHLVDGDPCEDLGQGKATQRWWCCDCATEFKSTYELKAVEITKPCEEHMSLENMVNVFQSHTLDELKVLCVDNDIELVDGHLFKTENVYKIRELMNQN